MKKVQIGVFMHVIQRFFLLPAVILGKPFDRACIGQRFHHSLIFFPERRMEATIRMVQRSQTKESESEISRNTGISRQGFLNLNTLITKGDLARIDQGQDEFQK